MVLGLPPEPAGGPGQGQDALELFSIRLATQTRRETPNTRRRSGLSGKFGHK